MTDDTPDFDPDRFEALAGKAEQDDMTADEIDELCEQLTALQGLLAECAETAIPLMKDHVRTLGEQSSDWGDHEDA